ncbi:putative nucleotide-binding alpha-beta plait domain superfamily, RNA-binding domain superfamily [Helianthus annuus]|uniref:Nucleotide-binding alpha-beta plait domain superfamily, RNA-binding domain superfamily n=1 Tax=Helianthus annuus TaxID=4232 RepID=A0A251SQB3_HELAN|nr:putative nucleotide-binding alpha-beta plait domain superfamily, RNA-binding domain superfamily [Helianthus annuus]KAJ0848458.1 putative nucleotide-binding alpha-beta plait domain superfamily, RNA-binding domain superfamily [Helianthus annuus]
MPKDPSTKGHHGIGFITFSNADSVDDLMSKTHELGGSDVVVDRATLRKTISDQLAACRLRVTDMVPIMLMLQLDMLHWELLQHMIIQALSMEEENPLGALRLAPFKTKQHATCMDYWYQLMQ